MFQNCHTLFIYTNSVQWCQMNSQNRRCIFMHASWNSKEGRKTPAPENNACNDYCTPKMAKTNFLFFLFCFFFVRKINPLCHIIDQIKDCLERKSLIKSSYSYKYRPLLYQLGLNKSMTTMSKCETVSKLAIIMV